MVFGAVVAYCKGWYERSSNKLEWWKDLIYCISADGYTIFSKDDVVQWILNRFTYEEEFFKKANNSFGISWFYREMQSQKRFWKIGYGEELSDSDAIIFVFNYIINDTKTDLYEKIYKPTEKILPISDNGIVSVEEMFNDCDEQDLLCYDKERISSMLNKC